MRRRLRAPRDARGALEQIGPADIADEHEVARDHAHRVVRAAAAVGDLVAHMLGRMTRRVHHADLDVADLEHVAVLHEHRVVAAAAGLLVEPLVLPVGVAFVGEVDARAFLGELAHAREKVRVDVRLRRRDDAQPVGRGDLLVAVDVALGVDDDRLADLLATDEVGGFGKLLVVDLSEEHGVDLGLSAGLFAGWSKRIVGAIGARRAREGFAVPWKVQNFDAAGLSSACSA